MVSGQGSDSFQVSASSTAPWAGQADYLKQLYSRANQLYEQGPYQYYPGQTVAGFDPASMRAFNMVERRAAGGGPNLRAAVAENERTLSGEYLDPESNPYLSRFGEIGERNIRRKYLDTVQSLGSTLEASGRTGGGVQGNLRGRADEALATGLGDFYAQLYGGAYEGERGRMGAAVGQSVPLAAAESELSYRDVNALRSVGGQREAYSQRVIDDLIARFEQSQRGSAEKLAEFAGLLGGPVMSSQSNQFSKQSSHGFGILS